MIKNSLKTLQEKYGNVERETSNNLAKFMKRRRIEQHRTLEDVSRGVCSPSYLSKIENCQVEVDEYYFQSLFEKLDLEYENIKTEREISFFSKVIIFMRLSFCRYSSKIYFDLSLLPSFTQIISISCKLWANTESKHSFRKLSVLYTGMSSEILNLFSINIYFLK